MICNYSIVLGEDMEETPTYAFAHTDDLDMTDLATLILPSTRRYGFTGRLTLPVRHEEQDAQTRPMPLVRFIRMAAQAEKPLVYPGE